MTILPSLRIFSKVLLGHEPRLLDGINSTKANNRYWKVLDMRFISGHTLKQAGDELGVTPERIRQIESHALEILRQEFKKLT